MIAAGAYDVVVVGTGGSGAPYAVRRAEAGARVLLLEAGTVPTSRDQLPVAVLDGDSLAGVGPGSAYDWAYPATLAPGRDWTLARGRGLGGSTAVNGGYFVRARATDVERWASVGGDAWASAPVLAAYRRLEHDLDLAGAPGHGGAGPVPVARPAQDDPVTAAIVSAARSLGIPDEPDKNALVAALDPRATTGVGPLPRDVVDGVRWGTGLAYVLPALARRLLDVAGDARVLRVVIDRPAGGAPRATGVEILRDGRLETVRAGEVVLSAGAIGSAQLLLASGVGPALDLAAHDVPVVSDLPVGRATSNHPQISLAWHPRPGPQHSRPPAMATVVHLAPGAPGPPVSDDVELLPLLRPTDELLARAPGPSLAPALDLLVAVQRPASRGTARLASADPLVPPAIDQRYLSEQADQRVLRDGVRAAVTLIRAAGGGLVAAEEGTLDDRTLEDDGSLDRWVRDHLGTAFHLCGTAPFGPDDDDSAVTLPDGRIRGVDGLRVVDLSILPWVPSRGPAATAIMIGELLAAPPGR